MNFNDIHLIKDIQRIISDDKSRQKCEIVPFF